MVKILTFSKTRVSLSQIDVTPNYCPSSFNSSFSQLVPALVRIEDPLGLWFDPGNTSGPILDTGFCLL